MELLFIFAASAVFMAAIVPAHRATRLAYPEEIPYPEAFSLWAPHIIFFVGLLPFGAIPSAAISEYGASPNWMLASGSIHVLLIFAVTGNRLNWIRNRFADFREIGRNFVKASVWACVTLLIYTAMTFRLLSTIVSNSS